MERVLERELLNSVIRQHVNTHTNKLIAEGEGDSTLEVYPFRVQTKRVTQ